MPDYFDAPAIPGTVDPVVTIAETITFCQQAGLSLATPDDDSRIEAAIELAVSTLEDACGVTFTAQVHTETVRVVNGRAVLQPMVIEVTDIDGEPASIGPYESGIVPMADGDRTITYKHGHETVPPRVKRAVLLLTRHVLTVDPTDLDGRATFKSNELASWSLITPGVKGAVTPIPEVNQVIQDYRFPGGIT